MTPVEVTLPDWPYGSLMPILFAEAAAAFEELTLSGQDDQLKVQVPDAWPNLFREARFLSAVDFVQADRLRRKVAMEMARVMSKVDLLLVPSLRDEMLDDHELHRASVADAARGLRQGVARRGATGRPIPAHPLPKFNPPRRVPHGVTLIGRLFDEGTIGRAGLAHGAGVQRRGRAAARASRSNDGGRRRADGGRRTADGGWRMGVIPSVSGRHPQRQRGIFCEVLVARPATMTFREASSLPLGMTTAAARDDNAGARDDNATARDDNAFSRHPPFRPPPS